MVFPADHVTDQLLQNQLNHSNARGVTALAPLTSEKMSASLINLPLEIRLNIWRYSIPPYVEADCCDHGSPDSSRRITSNQWYPANILPAFTYPSPRTPLRLVCHQANDEIQTNLPLPPLIGRVCDFLCLCRALNVLSNHASHANNIDMAHITAFRVTSERINLFRPLYSSAGEETGFTVSLRSDEGATKARVNRLAQSYLNELFHHFREVRLAHFDCNESANSPFSLEVTLLFEVFKPIKTVIHGDGGSVVARSGA